MIASVAVGLVTTLPGCGFTPDAEEGVAGWFDPYHDDLAGLNREYTHNPLTSVPTVVGNILGVAGFLPATLITAAFGHPQGSPYSFFEYSAWASAYAGGFLVGSPFVLVNLVLVRWWYGWVFDDEEEPGSSSES